MAKGPESPDSAPDMSPVDSEEDSVFDSEAYSEDFEDQGSSDEDEEILDRQKDTDESDDDEGIVVSYEKEGDRKWSSSSVALSSSSSKRSKDPQWMHTNDFSSDEEDEDGTGNRIGRVPLHWYDEFDHIGYDTHGKKVIKSVSGGDRLEDAIALQDNMAQGRFVVHDLLNDRNVELSRRQIELVRRVQGGAFAHPEHDANPEYIDYFSGVDKQKSGLGSQQHEKKSRFQPSKWEKMQIDKLVEKLERGDINMDYLQGKIKDMNEVRKSKMDPNKPFQLWTGEEEEDMHKGPQHIPAPKLPPPGHAESYVPPEEYLPTKEDLEKWADMEPKDRPHGHLVPKKFPNLRSVGAYEHSVREAFERCLDLYLCSRVMKKRLNIDPESLVPQLPKASDLRPFPTTKCIEYVIPYKGDTAPMVRCVCTSPDGQFMASGATDGSVRIWEVETGRLLQTWMISSLLFADEEEDIKPVVALEWNPSKHHHCLLAAIGDCAVIIATGTANRGDAQGVEALLAAALKGGNVSNAKANKAVKWQTLERSSKAAGISSSLVGPVCSLKTSGSVASVRWHAKGDYFVSVSPKAGAASVLIHQLSKGNSQQPFSKSKGETQLACFHPNKPFLFVASQQHVRVYHLVKQTMVKRLASGCRWISSLDVHSSGDHLIVGSLDRRMVWFDLDLSGTPYKTLKYHERAIRSSRFHRRYPLMASASDDGAVHIFHSMVYNDLIRNPLIVPVKILRGHSVVNKVGVLAVAFHPTQPWIFSAGADGRVLLFQDI